MGSQAINRIVRIMVQSCPRMDSITALYLLKTPEGARKYPGVENARVEFWDTGTISPDGRNWEQYLEEGTILIGVGGGPFDEHSSTDFGDRKAENLSATALVARDLGLEKSKLYGPLIRNVTENDLNPVKSQDALSNIVKLMHRMPDMGPTEVMRWTFCAIDAIVNSQRQFLAAVEEFKDTADVRTFQGDGGEYRIAFVESDSTQMWAAARYRDKSLTALVQMRHSGKFQIFGNTNLGVKLDKVAGAIRKAELAVRGSGQPTPEASTLEQPGQLPTVPCWCYQVPGDNMLNGSETACGVETTHLTSLQILPIVRDNIHFE